MPPTPDQFVSRGGIKLAHALDELQIDVRGLVCADFGCSVGGFTDCLLQRGASHVYALDTAYGVLDYRLRTDSRVTVMERTNVLHADPPEGDVDLIVIDAGWTRQGLILPAARRWLDARTQSAGSIITLIKPHYEQQRIRLVEPTASASANLPILSDVEAERVMQAVVDQIGETGWVVLGVVRSPIRGGGSRRKSRSVGNIEYLAYLRASAISA